MSFLRWGNICSVQNQLTPKGTTFCKFSSCIERIPFQNSFCTNNQGTCTWTVRLARVSPTCKMNPSKKFPLPSRQNWHQSPFLVISTGCAKWKWFSGLFRSRSQLYLRYQVDPWDLRINGNIFQTCDWPPRCPLGPHCHGSYPIPLSIFVEEFCDENHDELRSLQFHQLRHCQDWVEGGRDFCVEFVGKDRNFWGILFIMVWTDEPFSVFSILFYVLLTHALKILLHFNIFLAKWWEHVESGVVDYTCNPSQKFPTKSH